MSSLQAEGEKVSISTIRQDVELASNARTSTSLRTWLPANFAGGNALIRRWQPFPLLRALQLVITLLHLTPWHRPECESAFFQQTRQPVFRLLLLDQDIRRHARQKLCHEETLIAKSPRCHCIRGYHRGYVYHSIFIQRDI